MDSNKIKNMNDDDDDAINLFDDSILTTRKKMTLKDYDDRIKELLNENITLKLRVYLLEEGNMNAVDPYFNELNRDLNEKILQYHEVIEMLKSELHEKQMAIDMYENDETEKLRNIEKKQHEKSQHYEKCIDDLQNRLKYMQQDLNTQKEMNCNLKIQLTQTEQMLKEKDGQINLLKLNKQNALAKYKEASDAHIDNLMNQIVKKDNQINGLSSDVNQLKSSDDSNGDNSRLSGLQLKINQLNESLNKKEQKLKHFKTKFQSLKTNNRKFRDILGEFEEIMSKPNSDNKARENLLSDLKNKFKLNEEKKKHADEDILSYDIESFRRNRLSSSKRSQSVNSDLNTKTDNNSSDSRPPSRVDDLVAAVPAVAIIPVRSNDNEEIKKLTSEKNDLNLKLAEANDEITYLKAKCDQQKDDISNLTNSLTEQQTEMASIKSKDDLKQRKLDGLLKIVQQKSAEIESLKKTNAKFIESSEAAGKMSSKNVNNENYSVLMEALEKEIDIYKRLNDFKTTNQSVKDNLAEIIKLRNQLLKSTITSSAAHASASNEHNSSFHSVELLDKSTNKNNGKSGGTGLFNTQSLEKLNQDNFYDNYDGTNKASTSLTDFKYSYDSAIDASTNKMNDESDRNYQSDFYSSSQLKVADLLYKKHSRNELIRLLQQYDVESKTLKRQLEKRSPKITELHYELEALREKLDKAETLNDYLKKQIEIHHITHGNVDILLEMAKDLNLSKEEIEAYKNQLNSTPKKDITETFLKSVKNSQTSSPSNATVVKPTQQIKITVQTLENEIEYLKEKCRRLQMLFLRIDNGYRGLKFRQKRKDDLVAVPGSLTKQYRQKCLSDSNLYELLKQSNQENDDFYDQTMAQSTILLQQNEDLFNNDYTTSSVLLNHSNLYASNKLTAGVNSAAQQQNQQSEINKLNQKIKENETKMAKLSEANQTLLNKLYCFYNGLKPQGLNKTKLNKLFGPELLGLFSSLDEKLDPSSQEQVDLVQQIVTGAKDNYEKIKKKLDEVENKYHKADTSKLKLEDEIREKQKEKDLILKQLNSLNSKAANHKNDQSALLDQQQKFQQKSRSSSDLSNGSSGGQLLNDHADDDIRDLKRRFTLMKDDFKTAIGKYKNGAKNGKKVDFKDMIGTLERFSLNLAECDEEMNKLEMPARVSLRNEFSDYFSKNSFQHFKSKLQKYKNEIQRLKEKIRLQNLDIQEALNCLSKTNKDKENTQEYISYLLIQEKLQKNSTNNFENLENQLQETHSKLRKARDNIQSKVDDAGVAELKPKALHENNK